MQQNIFIGGALTMIVLMLFLHLGRADAAVGAAGARGIASRRPGSRPGSSSSALALILGAGFWFARGALVVGLAIPTSIIGTFLVLGVLGRSLNVISLAGLAFAVGMLVDNAVVVLENIYRHAQLGRHAASTAAVRGTQGSLGRRRRLDADHPRRVPAGVCSSRRKRANCSATSPWRSAAAVGLSLIVSVTVIPTAAARLLRPHGRPMRTTAPGDDRRAAPAAAATLSRAVADAAGAREWPIVWRGAGSADGRGLVVGRRCVDRVVTRRLDQRS